MSAERLLILGGTFEAGALARAALARFGERLEVTTSLAGRTQRPGPLPGEVRIGGFGGPEGLAQYLREHEIDRLIDATHPFASRISAEARIACELAAVPRLILLRPPWRRHPLDRWVEADDIPAAAAIVGRLARRAFLTVGHSDIAAFAAAPQVRFLVRLVDPPRTPLPLRFHEIILARGPFTLAAERHLLQRYAIEALVCKASGGAATEAKILAARDLSLPVVMVRRPPVEAGPRADSIEAALDWLAGPAAAFTARSAR
ncbi:MAG TPA: cobalt-precorrin-6A reductase [Stellaceae bacterium]|nr:cobalt-precorrin-6A reductase [Stellaceae bacterium]